MPNQSSKDATVMGMAHGYGILAYKKFVGSLRSTGYQGNILLIVAPLSDLDNEAKDFLIENNVTTIPLEPVPCTTAPKFLMQRNPQDRNGQQEERVTCGYPYPQFKLRWGRFALLRDALKNCTTCTGPVLITDVRDTFFQRDPFGPEAPPVTGLQLFEEDPQQSTAHWLTKGPIERCKNIPIFDKVMLCSGTTIGTRSTMIQYLNAMLQEMNLWLESPSTCNFPGNGDDQAIHNYLYYTVQLDHIGDLRVFPNGQGLVHTVGKYGTQALQQKRERLARELAIPPPKAQLKPYTSEEEEAAGNWLDASQWSDVSVSYRLTDTQGFFLNKNGEQSFIVHQYDRFGTPLERWLFQSGPCHQVGV